VSTIGPRRTAPPVSQPEGFVAPYDAFEPRFKALNDLLLVIFGIEVRAGDATALGQRLLKELDRNDGPELLEHGLVKDGFGPSSQTWFAYWKSQNDYETWLSNSEIESMFADPSLLTGNLGLWREVCHISLDHNETSSSREDALTGIANLCDGLEITPTHAYWGSMRDRMVAAAQSGLEAENNTKSLALNQTMGKRVKVQAAENVCLIKTTQDLSQTNSTQRALYTTNVEPALHAGLHFLRKNPLDSGCIGMRFIEEVTSSGESGNRTVGVGYFASLEHLEQWTHNHPTHIEIMTQFGAMVEQFQGQPGLSLWHEVTVFPVGRLVGDYVNCSADGTLMGAA